MKTLLCILIFSTRLFSWDDHANLTRISLKNSDWIKNLKSIPVQKLESFLKTQNLDFETFKSQYEFNPKMALSEFKYETESSVRPASVLIQYSDEPDLNIDFNLIHPDQEWMGGSTGNTSKGFRHLYFRALDWKRPLVTFHIPLREIGQGPKRAEVCFGLAKKAFDAKQPYWGFRFAAWALHYIQDLTQPYHSNQPVTHKFFPFSTLWETFSLSAFIKETTRINANYHYLFEHLVAYVLKDPVNYPFGKNWVASLTSNFGIVPTLPSALDIAKHGSALAADYAYELGNISILFFGEKFKEKGVDVANTKVGLNMTSLPTTDTALIEKFQTTISKVFTITGDVTRELATLTKTYDHHQSK